MSNALDYTITINSNFDKVNASFNSFQKNIGGGIDKINKSLNSIRLSSIIQQIGNVADGINSINAPGLELGSSMADLSAITGVTGGKLKEIEQFARESAKTFGGSAAQGVEAYKLVLSQLNPEIAKVPDALKAMGNSINTLSKTMGGDTVAATEVLTTAMNQYQVSTVDPIEASKEMAIMMNVMAAAAKEGSAELPQIKNALEQSGLAAKTANVSFAETNAAIQVLDKSGKKGAEGGVALRNVMATLAEGRFLPKEVKAELANAGISVDALGDRSKSLHDRLIPLKKIMNDQALVTKLFGKENNAAAISLISGTDEMARLTTAIQGTNTAYEQAGIIMESQAEKNKRLTASVDDFKISLFNGTNGLMGYASVIGNTTRDFSNMMPLISGAGKVFSTLTSATKLQALWTGIVSGATKVWTGVQMVFNAVMAANPVILIVASIMALIAAIAWVVTSTEGWGNAWKHTVNGAKLLFMAYVDTVKLYFTTLVEGIMLGINKIKTGWYEFKNAVGMGSKSENDGMLAKIHADTETRKKAIIGAAQKVKKDLLGAKDEFGKTISSVHIIKDKKGANDIADPTQPGVIKSPAGFGSGAGSDKAKKSNEAIATGGTKNTVINITLGEMIGIKTGTVNASKEAIDKAASAMEDNLLRVLAMASSAAS